MVTSRVDSFVASIVFIFNNSEGIHQQGWYKYTDFFINVLVALDDCNKDNGTIQLANHHKASFDELIQNTRNDGTPILLKEVEKNLEFKEIDLKAGDLVFFSSTCPHRSDRNNSSASRRTLYYTYSLLKNGSFYEDYFNDKKQSKNKTDKSLSIKFS